MAAIDDKHQALRAILGEFDRLWVAYSGGTDSTLLLRVARDVLGDRVEAIIADSPSLPRAEMEEALALARAMGVEPRVIHTHEIDDSDYVENPVDRCYFCKRELFTVMADLAARDGMAVLAFGENADDAADYRPGAAAARELAVRAPLREAGLAKAEVRELSRQLGLPTWNKPASPCLSSRFPYGERITREGLRQVEEAEAFLHRCGFRELRVRHHGNLARIEVPAAEIPRLAEPAVREAVHIELRRLGYLFVCVDLAGYRSGALNIVLTESPAVPR